MSPKDAKEKKIKRLPESELFALAGDRERAATQAAEHETQKKECDQKLISQLQLREVGSLESKKYGPFTRITLVEPEKVEFDSAGIWADLKPAQRELAFDRNVNLNALDADARQRVLDVLSKAELEAVTSRPINLDSLAKAVSDGKIGKKVVAKHSTVKKIAPSVRISHGSAS